MADDEIVDGEIVDDDEQDSEETLDVIDAEVVDDAEWPVYDAAIAYLDAGWAPTPLRDKIPTQKRWTALRPSKPDCWSWWVEDRHNGVGVVCGRISGNLLVVDIESELVADQKRMGSVIQAAEAAGVAGLLTRCFTSSASTTPSGGRHLYFKVIDTEVVPGNEKLAFRGSGDTAILLVETRGEGGQVAAPPGGGREWIGDAGPGRTTDVTAAQLACILDAFRSLDESGIKHTPPRKPSAPYTPDPDRKPSVADAWTDAMMAGAITWTDVLDDGWTPNGYDDEDRSLWVRPDYGDKTKAPYSAKGFEGWRGGARPVLVVHSTSVAHLPQGEGQRLTPARVWAHCFFNGDEAAANAALEQAATTGDMDPRITRDIPTVVLDGARVICEDRGDPAPLEAFTPDTSQADWWDERPWLRHIHTFARSRMVSPYALLSVALVRVAADTLPDTTLPAIVGGRGSLNLFCALVGPSGAGKTAVCAASDELLPWADPWVHIGSGEGLLHTFVTKVKAEDIDKPGKFIWKLDQHTYKAAAIVDEIDTFTALGARQGATLLPTLRSAWSGSTIGFGYADPSKRLSLAAHSYRLGLVVGAQPLRCEALFDEADAGTPQRFIWAPLTDPNAPDDLPDNPGPLPQPGLFTKPGAQEIAVCESLRSTVRANRTQTLRTGQTNGLDGHALLNRVKAAAAIALMEGRQEVTDDDWELAGRIQETSDLTRAWVQAQIAGERAKTGRQRAEIKAAEAVVVDQTLSEAVVARCAKVVARAVHRAGETGMTRNQARRSLAPRDRKTFTPAVDLAVALRWVEESDRPHAQQSDKAVKVLIPGKEKP